MKKYGICIPALPNQARYLRGLACTHRFQNLLPLNDYRLPVIPGFLSFIPILCSTAQIFEFQKLIAEL